MSVEEEIDDDTLLERIAQKDRRAFRLLMERHGKAMIIMAQRVTGNTTDADDIVQEAFLKVWLTAARWQSGKAAFSTWFYRVVLNLCIDRQRQRSFCSLEDMKNTKRNDVDYVEPQGIERTLHAQQHATIMRAMEDLPGKQRKALTLYYFADMTAPEAANVLSLSTSAFEALLFRGKKALRKMLKYKGITNSGDIL